MITVERSDRGPNPLMGRFGGGWQWNLGVQVGASKKTIIVNLIWRQYRITRGGKP